MGAPSFDERSVVGKSETEAMSLLAANGREGRVIHRDGTDVLATTDYAPGRVNMKVVAGLVTEVSTG